MATSLKRASSVCARPRVLRYPLPQHVVMIRSKGREYFYFQKFRGTQREEPRHPLPGCPTNPDGTPNGTWWAAYRLHAGDTVRRPHAGTFDALIAAYQASPEFAASQEDGGLAESTRKNWARYHKEISRAWGDLPVCALEPKHVHKLRDAFADISPASPEPGRVYKNRPASANNLLRALSAMIAWGVPQGWRTDNPCDHVKKIGGGEPYPAWTLREIQHFRKHARAELWWVAAVALYTGQRQGDVLAMKHGDIVHLDGVPGVYVRPEKTKKARKAKESGGRIWVPLHRDLRTILAEMPRRSIFLLTSSEGTRWTKDGFRASWQAEMNRRIFRPLRRHRRVFHGLRKSAVVFMLEAGCTTKQVSSITGQSLEMIELYSEQVNQPKMARAAILRWEGRS